MVSTREFSQTVDKVYFFDLCCKSLAEFRRPQTAEEGPKPFSRGHVPREKHFSAHKRTRFARATQGAAFPLKNACIFEKRVEVSRHAKNPLPIGQGIFSLSKNLASGGVLLV